MKDKKVIVIINNLGIGGAERLVVDEINEMLRLGISVYLITLKKEKENTFLNDCLINKKNHIHIDFINLLDFSSWSRLIKVLNNINPDIIFTHLWFSNTIGRISAFLSGIKNIYSFEHNIDNVKSYKTIISDIFLQFLCKKIIAVSSAVKNSLIKNFIISSRIKVIINGINVDKFKNAKPYDRRLLGIKDGDFIFISIGRLIYQKGFDTLIDSFSKINSANSHLLIVGEGPLKQSLIDQSLNYGLSKKIHFLGVRSDIPQLLQMSDCFVLSSRWEGLGIVIMEAMSSLKPVIITDFEARRDIVNDDTGFIVKNIDDLVGYMSKIKDGSYDKDKLLKNIENKIYDFSIQKHVNYLINLI